MDEDEDIMATSEVVSLRDPILQTRISKPGRSSSCKHTQCFDLETFFTMNERSPTYSCPVCNVHIKWEDVILDEFFEGILIGTTGYDIETVEIQPDGSWEISPDVKLEKKEPEATGDVLDLDDDDEDEDQPLVPLISPAKQRVPRPAPPVPEPEEDDDVIDLTLSDDDDVDVIRLPRARTPPTNLPFLNPIPNFGHDYSQPVNHSPVQMQPFVSLNGQSLMQPNTTFLQSHLPATSTSLSNHFADTAIFDDVLAQLNLPAIQMEEQNRVIQEASPASTPFAPPTHLPNALPTSSSFPSLSSATPSSLSGTLSTVPTMDTVTTSASLDLPSSEDLMPTPSELVLSQAQLALPNVMPSSDTMANPSSTSPAQSPILESIPHSHVSSSASSTSDEFSDITPTPSVIDALEQSAILAEEALGSQPDMDSPEALPITPPLTSIQPTTELSPPSSDFAIEPSPSYHSSDPSHQVTASELDDLSYEPVSLSAQEGRTLQEIANTIVAEMKERNLGQGLPTRSPASQKRNPDGARKRSFSQLG